VGCLRGVMVGVVMVVDPFFLPQRELLGNHPSELCGGRCVVLNAADTKLPPERVVKTQRDLAHGSLSRPAQQIAGTLRASRRAGRGGGMM